TTLLGGRDHMPGLGVGETGTGRGRDCAATAGAGHLSGYGGSRTGRVSCPAGRGVWTRGTTRRRAYYTGRAAGYDTQNWRVLGGGGTVSAQRRIVSAVRSPESAVRDCHPPRGGGS